MQLVGTCNLCGGPVTVPEMWGGLTPPVPRCTACGATKKQPYGTLVDMEPGSRPTLSKGPHDFQEPTRSSGEE